MAMYDYDMIMIRIWC